MAVPQMAALKGVVSVIPSFSYRPNAIFFLQADICTELSGAAEGDGITFHS